MVQTGGLNNYTNYISGGVYKNGTLSFISTGQGWTNMEPATPRQEYFVKDHLGNIRSTVASAVTGGVSPGPQSLAYTAGYEPADEAVETALFDKVSELRADKPGSPGTADQKAALLQDNQRLGTSIMLKVMAGDKVDINAESFYESLQQGNSNNEAAAGQLFEQVIGGLAGGSGALNSAEGSSPGVLTERILSNPEAVTAYEDLLAAETDSTRPKAFLNFLFFDEEMNLVPEHSRIWQADGESNWSRIGSEEYTSLEMPQNGYIVSYLSNQSEQEAWFDNMSVAVSPGILLEERHYYAYGLPIAGLGSQAATATKNRQRYQGNEYLEELGLEWMDFHNRQYDPQLGRFLSVDPLADAGGQHVLSPYHAMACNPVSMVDPLGLRAGQFPGTHTLLPTIANAGIHVFEDGTVAVFGGNALNFAAWQQRASDRYGDFTLEAFVRLLLGAWTEIAQSNTSGAPGSGSVGSGTNQASEGLTISSNGTKYRITHNGGLKVSEILEPVNVIGKKADWGDWGKRMKARYGNSFGYGFGGYGQGNGFWEDVETGFSILWNSPLVRRYVPDKITIALGAEITLFGGVGIQPINFSILTRGKEPGIYYTPTVNVNAGVGSFFSAGFELTMSNHTGDPREITGGMLEGNTFGLMGTGGYLGAFSVGTSFSPTSARGNAGFINASAGIGADVGLFGGVQYQNTVGYIPIWKW